ncbi:MAG: trypsin-like serine protease [Polyangiales bacterium]
MHRSSLVFVGLAGLAFVGCSAPSSGDEQGSGSRNGEIVGGVKATDYEESALVNMLDGSGSMFAACSGSVIAPRVVLTAGHCVDGVSGFQVIAPYTKSGKQTAGSHKGTALDWIDVAGESVDPSKHDVGLVILDTPITLTKWPTVRKTQYPFGSKARNLGRIQSGSFSSTDIFVSKPLTMNDANSDGFPYDYISDEIIESGDSGGPVIADGTHEIIAVNSGAGGGTEVLARVDLVWSWIDSTVKSNGGWPADPGPTPPPDDPSGGPKDDSDADGVVDQEDLCSATPKGAPVWMTGEEWIGCSEGQVRDGGGGVDSDGDGIPDNKDKCTHTKPSTPVWDYGTWVGCGAGEHRDK